MDASNTKPYHLPADAVWFITGSPSGIGHALASDLLPSTSNRGNHDSARRVQPLLAASQRKPPNPSPRRGLLPRPSAPEAVAKELPPRVEPAENPGAVVAADVAAASYRLVAGAEAEAGGTSPSIRLPLGLDSWGTRKDNVEEVVNDLDGFKDLSLSVGRADQLESTNFLRRE
ncbi:hypothetical protein F4780DRAFT_783468 [Xylariomycetidae sp. FL0641]|nr:hypothetical protein F4780DRAFT_783468 [Xylariomycetidae sp. FL0641]